MTAYLLQSNLNKIIKERNLQIVDLERKAGLKKNSVYNIVKGISKNPSVQSVQAIAEALGMSTEKLCLETKNKDDYLTSEKLNLITRLSNIIAEEVNQLGVKITYAEYVDILGKILDYDNLSKDGEPKYRFAQWLLLNLKK